MCTICFWLCIKVDIAAKFTAEIIDRRYYNQQRSCCKMVAIGIETSAMGFAQNNLLLYCVAARQVVMHSE